MGLDTNLVKFKKNDFDKSARDCRGHRCLDYFDGHEINTEIAYYRKCYGLQSILMEVLCHPRQCAYTEITRKDLDKVKRVALRSRSKNPEEAAAFIDDIFRIIMETDFETEVVAFTWIS